MDRIRGQADRIYRDGQFYGAVVVVVDVPEPSPLPPDDWLGVDLGIVNRAAESDGTVDGLRTRPEKLR
jgi:transposase